MMKTAKAIGKNQRKDAEAIIASINIELANMRDSAEDCESSLEDIVIDIKRNRVPEKALNELQGNILMMEAHAIDAKEALAKLKDCINKRAEMAK
jgi:hypothetical protein